jgi:hypothetical protein
LDSRELEETSIGNYSGHASTASRLRTELTDQAGLTKPKNKHEYFPNLPEPKGFSHGHPASRRQSSRDDGRLNVMSAWTNMDSVDSIDTIAEAPFYIASTGPSARNLTFDALV